MEELLPHSVSVDEDQPHEEEEEEEEEIDEHEEEETMLEQQSQQQQQQIEKQEQPIMESALLVQEVMKAQELPPPAIRPTTLDLECMSLCSDFLSPLSPVSQQVSRVTTLNDRFKRLDSVHE